MNVWLNVFNEAPSRWINAAFILALERVNNTDHSQLVISVYDKPVSAEAKRMNQLPFTPCGKVGHDWYYLEKGEPVVLTQGPSDAGSVRRKDGRDRNRNVQVDDRPAKRRPTRR